MKDTYRKVLEHLRDTLIRAGEEAETPLSPLMTVADLSIMVLVEQAGGNFEKFQAVFEVFMSRIEKNVDAEVERQKKLRN